MDDEAFTAAVDEIRGQQREKERKAINLQDMDFSSFDPNDYDF